MRNENFKSLTLDPGKLIIRCICDFGAYLMGDKRRISLCIRAVSSEPSLFAQSNEVDEDARSLTQIADPTNINILVSVNKLIGLCYAVKIRPK